MHQGRWFIYDLRTSFDHNPEATFMPFSPDIVQKFRDINQTASDLFLSKLTHILHEEEDLRRAQDLPPGDLDNFVEDLDRVCEQSLPFSLC
jgi:hypothetical protein